MLLILERISPKEVRLCPLCIVKWVTMKGSTRKCTKKRYRFKMREIVQIPPSLFPMLSAEGRCFVLTYFNSFLYKIASFARIPQPILAPAWDHLFTTFSSLNQAKQRQSEAPGN